MAPTSHLRVAVTGVDPTVVAESSTRSRSVVWSGRTAGRLPQGGRELRRLLRLAKDDVSDDLDAGDDEADQQERRQPAARELRRDQKQREQCDGREAVG